MIYLSMIDPDAVTFDPDEVKRINRVRIAERLGCLPSEIDKQPAAYIQDCLAVWHADEMKEARDEKMRR